MMYSPRQTVLVSCKGIFNHFGKSEEVEDVFPLEKHSPASDSPKKYIILVSKNSPAASIIHNSKAFVVNFMPYSEVDSVIKAGTLHGAFHDKFSSTGLEKANCEKLTDIHRVKNASAWIECRVEGEFETGDHMLFLGEILYEEEVNNEKRTFRVDGQRFTTTR